MHESLAFFGGCTKVSRFSEGARKSPILTTVRAIFLLFLPVYSTDVPVVKIWVSAGGNTTEESSVSVREGRGVVLRCTVLANPPAYTISWYHNVSHWYTISWYHNVSHWSIVSYT